MNNNHAVTDPITQQIADTVRQVMLDENLPNPCELHGEYPQGDVCQKCLDLALFSVSARLSNPG